MKKILSLIVIFVLTFEQSYAQGADFLRSMGKIYSVVAVIAIVFLGIAYYLYRIDRKLTKLENQINNEQ